jgi:hypothetical protein
MLTPPPYTPFQLLKPPYMDPLPLRLPEEELFPFPFPLPFEVIEKEFGRGFGVDDLGGGKTNEPGPDALRVEGLAAITIGWPCGDIAFRFFIFG